jgi:hypothetical protein
MGLQHETEGMTDQTFIHSGKVVAADSEKRFEFLPVHTGSGGASVPLSTQHLSFFPASEYHFF